MKHYNIPVIKLARLRTQSSLTTLKGVKIVTKRLLGNYKKGVITIYPNSHDTTADYIDTLLHELAHHTIAHYRQQDKTLHLSPHGKDWRRVAEFLGANPRATQQLNKVTLPYYLKEGGITL